MRGAVPAKLGAEARIEGDFTINKGVLGSFDLSRAIQTAGKETQGRTLFAELTGRGVYDRRRGRAARRQPRRRAR